MMHPPDRLGEHPRHPQHLQLLAPLQMLLLRHRVRHDDRVQATRIDAVDGVAGENSVRHECDDRMRAVAFEQFGGAGDGV